MDPREAIRRMVSAEREARRILATHESSGTRVFTVEATYARLGRLSIQQDDLLRQALRAIEHGLYRSSIVMAWAAFMDFVEEKLASDKFQALNASYVDWKIVDIEDLRDRKPEYQIIEALRKVKLCSKGEAKSILGLLGTRNEAAHPSAFLPDLNESLGFVSNLLQRIERMKQRWPSP